MFELFFAQKSVEEKENIEDDKMYKDLAEYIVNNHVTSDDIEESYFKLCGVVDENVVSNDTVNKLLAKMKSMTDQRFPLNRFVKLIETAQSVENGENDFYTFVDTLDVTIKEKNMLKSIVSMMRSGDMSISIEGNDKQFSEISINATNVPKHIFGFMLSRKIKEVLARLPHEAKIEFSFEEK